jgi:fumarate hydratase class II
MAREVFMDKPPLRAEHDTLGELLVPASALYGAQTQRAIENFPVSGLRMPRAFIRALALIKYAAADANGRLGHLSADRAKAIMRAATQVASGAHDAHFPVDVFQTGSGTSSNMNANEVIASLASTARRRVHPNDHVNFGQSSNDVVPSAISVACVLEARTALLPALRHLKVAIDRRARALALTTKTGRTHLMDAMPLTFGQELSGWSAQLGSATERIENTLTRLCKLPLGGTAVGTGVNADPRFAKLALGALSKVSRTKFTSARNLFEGIASQDASVELSGQLNALAVALMKIANDLRWMNSGPLAGLAEISLPALQPGSSIMPGKVNPVVPEAVCMVCAQVMGHHVTVTIAAASGNFQLNVMLPLIAYDVLSSITMLSNASRMLADTAIDGFVVNEARIEENLAKNPMLVTALNPIIGYEAAAAIAKKAYRERRAIRDVALEETTLTKGELDELLDPNRLTGARPRRRASIRVKPVA